jgi:DNA-binding NarL/FixJ family response regulator
MRFRRCGLSLTEMPGKKNPRKNSQMAKKVPYYVLAKLNDRNCKGHTLMEYAAAKGEPIKAIARFFRVTPAAVRYHRNKLSQKLKDKQPTRKKNRRAVEKTEERHAATEPCEDARYETCRAL